MAFSKRIFMAFYSEYGMSPQQMSNRIKESKRGLEPSEIDECFVTKKKIKKNELELQNISVPEQF